MDAVSIELDDTMTLGTLRGLAEGLGKRLVVSFEDAPPARRGRPPATPPPAAPAPKRRKRRRKLSPEGRAALAKNLEKARAARSAKVARAK